MKKFLRIILIILLLVFVFGYFFGVPRVANMIAQQGMVFSPYTLDTVYNSQEMREEHYYIGDKKTPTDYGFENWENIEFTSVYDKDIQLSGWFVRSAAADSLPCVILSHGRTANRLKPMKYLELFESMGLDSAYNFFIPDFRNSGTSTPAPTEFGNKFGEDLTAACLMLNDKFGIKNLTLYSFSMGATASGIMLWRNDLNQRLIDNNITIDKMVFDSPLSNIEKTLEKTGKEMGLPNLILNKGFAILEKEITNNTGKSVFRDMKFSTLLKDAKMPILMLQNEADKSTLNSLLQEELNGLKGANIKTVVFDNAINAEFVHVRLLIHHREAYEKAVRAFLVD